MSNPAQNQCQHDKRFKGVFNCLNGCLACEVEQLTFKLEVYERTEQKWIPCSQRMPIESDLVLVYTPTTDDVVIAGYDHDGWTTEERAYPVIEVTHWMPLPANPDKQ